MHIKGTEMGSGLCGFIKQKLCLMNLVDFMVEWLP